MTRKNLPIALYLLLVFGSGAVVGALGYRTYNPPTARSGSASQAPAPGEWRRQYMEESKARLDLTPDQVQKLTVILDQTDARFRQARQQGNAAIKQIRDEHIARVIELLSPEQRPKYDQLRMERERRVKQQQESNQSH